MIDRMPRTGTAAPTTRAPVRRSGRRLAPGATLAIAVGVLDELVAALSAAAQPAS